MRLCVSASVYIRLCVCVCACVCAAQARISSESNAMATANINGKSGNLCNPYTAAAMAGVESECEREESVDLGCSRYRAPRPMSAVWRHPQRPQQRRRVYDSAPPPRNMYDCIGNGGAV